MSNLLQEARISLRDVARRFDKTYETVRNWTTIGCGGKVLEAVRIGGTWYTSEEAVERFSQTSEPLPDSLNSEDRRGAEVRERLKLEFGINSS